MTLPDWNMNTALQVALFCMLSLVAVGLLSIIGGIVGRIFVIGALVVGIIATLWAGWGLSPTEILSYVG